MSKSTSDKLDQLKENVEEYYRFFKNNTKRYKYSMRFAFKETLSPEDRRKLKKIQKPVLEINYISAYLSRLLGEMSKQTPEAVVSGIPDSVDSSGNLVYSDKQLSLNTLVEGILRELFYQYDKRGDKNQVLKEQCAGGYSVMKLITKYKGDGFDQELVLTKPKDPTLCYFDPMATRPSKSDGAWCGEAHPMSDDEFKRKYPKYEKCIDELREQSNSINGLKWKYKNGKKNIIIVMEYYQVEYENKKSVLLADGSDMMLSDYNKAKNDAIENGATEDILPKKVKQRSVEKPYIKRYIFCGNEILEEEKTSYKGLPYIFVDANSAFVYSSDDKGELEQVTNSYIQNAIGAQKLLNNTLQTVANFSENLMQQKMIVDKSAIPVGTENDWVNPQQVSVLLKNGHDEEDRPIVDPVTFIQQQDLPPSIMGTLSSMQQIMQNTFGSYDAMLGINKGDLSGIAIQEGATQNNAVAMPIINGLLDAINAVCELAVKMIPVIHVTPMTVPVMNEEGKRSYECINQIMPDGSPDPNSIQLNYEDDDLTVEASAGYSFEIQKDKSLRMLKELMPSFPSLAQIIDQYGQDIILDQINIRGVDKLKDRVKKIAAKKEESQQNQPSPEDMQHQAQQQELQLKMAQMQQDADYKNKKLMLDNQKLQADLEIERLKLAQSQARANAEIQNSAIDNAGKFAEHQLKQDDQHHRHAMDVMNMGG